MIGFLIFSLQGKEGGLRRTFEEKLSYFSKRGYRAYLLTYLPEYRFLHVKHGGTVINLQSRKKHEFALKRPWVFLRTMQFLVRVMQLVRAIKIYKIKIINLSSYLGLPEVFLSSLMTGIPYVLDLYETPFWSNTDLSKFSMIHKRAVACVLKASPGHRGPHNMRPRMSLAKRLVTELRALMYFLAVRRSRMVITLSRKMAREIALLYNKAATVMPIIASDLHINKVSTPSPDNEVVKFISDVKSRGKRLVLSVSVLNEHRKRISLLLHSVKIIRTLRPDVASRLHVLIVGRGPDANKLKELAHELGIADLTTFTGFIDDKTLSYVYEVSDVFAHPAYADFDLTLVEAAAFGLMQIWTSDTEFPSAFEPIRDAIIIVNPDPERFADAIIKAIRKVEDGAFQRKRLNAPSWDEYLKTYEDIFRKLLLS